MLPMPMTVMLLVIVTYPPLYIIGVFAFRFAAMKGGCCIRIHHILSVQCSLDRTKIQTVRTDVSAENKRRKTNWLLCGFLLIHESTAPGSQSGYIFKYIGSVANGKCTFCHKIQTVRTTCRERRNSIFNSYVTYLCVLDSWMYKLTRRTHGSHIALTLTMCLDLEPHSTAIEMVLKSMFRPIALTGSQG